MKRSQSVGVAQLSVFDRHHPLRQSIAAVPQPVKSNGIGGGGSSKLSSVGSGGSIVGVSTKNGGVTSSKGGASGLIKG